MGVADKVNKLLSIEDCFKKELNLDVSAGQNINCPFHSDKTPSMRVYGGSRGSYCFGQCGRAYSSFSIIKIVHADLKFSELLDYIKQEYQISIDSDTKNGSLGSKLTEVEKILIDNYDVLSEAVASEKDSSRILKKLEIAIYHAIDKGNDKYVQRLLSECIDSKNK